MILFFSKYIDDIYENSETKCDHSNDDYKNKKIIDIVSVIFKMVDIASTKKSNINDLKEKEKYCSEIAKYLLFGEDEETHNIEITTQIRNNLTITVKYHNTNSSVLLMIPRNNKKSLIKESCLSIVQFLSLDEPNEGKGTTTENTLIMNKKPNTNNIFDISFLELDNLVKRIEEELMDSKYSYSYLAYLLFNNKLNILLNNLIFETDKKYSILMDELITVANDFKGKMYYQLASRTLLINKCTHDIKEYANIYKLIEDNTFSQIAKEQFI